MFIYIIIALVILSLLTLVIKHTSDSQTAEEAQRAKQINSAMKKATTIISAVAALATLLITMYGSNSPALDDIEGYLRKLFPNAYIQPETQSTTDAPDETAQSANNITIRYPAATAYRAANQAVVHNSDPTDRLNLRVSPNSQSDTQGKYYNGVTVEILEETNSDWVKVKLANDRTGYMMREYLAFDDFAAVRNACPVYAVDGQAIKLYALPSKKAARIHAPYQADVVDVIGVYKNWWHVRYADTYGFMEGLESLWTKK